MRLTNVAARVSSTLQVGMSQTGMYIIMTHLFYCTPCPQK